MHHPGLRERKKQRTRHAIAMAAIELFAERGYEEATIADIAEAAEISPRTFFSYFPSKEDVVFCHMDDEMEAVRQRLAERPPGEIPRDTVRRVAVEVLEAMAGEHGPYGPTLVALILERPSLQARALQRFYEFEQEIIQYILEVSPEVGEAKAMVAGGVLMGGLREALIYCKSQGYGPAETRKAIEQALEIIENGLGSIPSFTQPSA